MISCLHPRDDLLFHADHLGRGVLWRGMSLFVSYGAKLSARNAALELHAHFAITELAHAAVENRLENRPLILDRRTLENVVSSIGDCLLRGLLQLLRGMMCALTRLRHYAVSLITEPRRQFAVPP